ncbi:MAG TPA: tetrahydrofolate dehydrogenase/cyclohydrolase catalytic domain-containing protein [Candidatus Azoamicus sp.]
MITKIFNNKHYYEKQIKILSNKINTCIKIYNKKPKLTIITIDNYFSTNLYIKNKIKSCIKTHTNNIIFKSSKSIKTHTLIKIIKFINIDKNINGIIIQLPLPNNLIKKNIFLSINEKKDIDLINPKSIGKYITGYKKNILPCTINAIKQVLTYTKIKTLGAKACIIGFSNIIGKPLTYLLYSMGITITIINKHDNNFKKIIKNNDIIIIAIGKKKHIKQSELSYGGIIIDVGINKYKNTLTVGDIDIKKKNQNSCYITPVPNGIGLLTIFNLLSNNFKLFLFQNKIKLK